MRNPFEISLEKKVNTAMNPVIQEAVSLLSSDNAIRYKKELEQARDILVGIMRRYTEPDPLKKAFFFEGIVKKLDAVYNILEGIEREARKRKIS